LRSKIFYSCVKMLITQGFLVAEVRKRTILLSSSASPYPNVEDGCKKLVVDYQDRVFRDDDVYFLACRPGDWAPIALYHRHARLAGEVSLERLAALGCDFTFWVGFAETEFTRKVTQLCPSFCLAASHPHPDIPDALFAGLLTHSAEASAPDLMLCGAGYDDRIFRPNRQAEEFVVSVARIHPDKGQLDLVRGYRERIYEPYGLPLLLVGGVGDLDYYAELAPWIDGAAVCSTIDPANPTSFTAWRDSSQIAALLNRARLFVLASPSENFGIALTEAMASGVTCVVNGHYSGFDPQDLRPHVFGNIAGARGSILTLIERALADDVRIDASIWVQRHSVSRSGEAQRAFVQKQLAGLDRRPELVATR
jgi:glycosyltransferase involved in cell wall biosynthesis